LRIDLYKWDNKQDTAIILDFNCLFEDHGSFEPSNDFSYVIVVTDKDNEVYMIDCSQGFRDTDAFDGVNLIDSVVSFDVELEPLSVYKLTDFKSWVDRDFYGDVDDWGYTAERAEKLYQIIRKD
jgi:hypothetical protein